jgi:hypothetical protein
MTSTISSARDVVQFLTGQHEEIKSLFARTIDASGSERERLFVELRRLLAVHETAEEEVVHPRARRELDDGDEVVDARLEEENEAKQALAELESLDVDSAEFARALTALRDDVVEHAEAEEHQEFNRLAAELDVDQLERMGRAARLAEATAPTRPHAGVESAGANMLAGPFASMLDRARDAINGRGK